MKRVFAVCFSFIYCALLCAQQQFVRYQHLLGNVDIRCVASSSDYLWVGTSNGMYIANNGNWIEFSDIFPASVTDGHFYSVSNMRSILPYRNKALLSADLITSCYDVLADTISMPLSYMNSRVIADAMCGYENIAYIYTRDQNSLFSYNFDNGQLDIIKTFKPSGYNFQRMIMVPGGKNILLIDKSGVLCLCDLTTHQITEISNIPNNAKASVALFDTTGDLWIGAENGIVFQGKLNLYSKQIESVKSYSIPWAFDNLFTDIIDTQSFICLATGNSGISFVSRPFGTVSNMDDRVIHNVNRLSSLGMGYFFGTSEHSGATVMRFSFVGTLSSASLNDNYSLAGNSIISIEEDSDGNIVIGTKQGIDRFDVKSLQTYSVTKADYSDIASMVSMDERFYLAMSQLSGLVTIDRYNGKIRKFLSPSLPNNVGTESLGHVRLVKDKDGLIYILNYGGVNFLYDRETGTAIRFSFDFSENGEFVEPVDLDNPDFAYFHSKYSIYQLDKAEMQTSRLVKLESIISKAVSLEDSVIVYSDGKSLYKYNCKDNKSRLFCSLDLFKGQPVFIVGMVLDRTGKELWLITSKSYVYKLDMESGELTVFPKDLYDRNHFVRYPLYAGSNGFLYFPGTSGVLVVNPNGFKPSDSDSLQVSASSFSCDDDVIYMNRNKKRFITLPNSFKMASCNLHVSNSDPLSSVYLHVVIKRSFFVVRDFYTSSLNVQLGNMSPGKYSLYASVLGAHGWGEMTHLTDVRLVRTPFLSIGALIVYFLVLLGIIALLFVSLIQNIRKKHNVIRPDNKDLKQSMVMIQHMVSQLKIPLMPAKELLDAAMKSNVENTDLFLQLVNVYAGVNEAGRIADCLLNMYFKDNGGNDTDIQSVDLNQWLAKFVSSFDLDCKANGVKLEFIPNTKIQSFNTDVKQLERALSFLIVTSIKNSPDSTITVKDDVVLQSYVRISVADRSNVHALSSDNSVGESQSQDDTQAINWKLSYLQSIVDKMQGRLAVSYRPDGGMLYMLDVPLISLDNGSSDSSGIVYDSISTSFVNTQKLSLLLVDDQQDVLDYIKNVLEDKLRKIYTAKDGVEALVCLEQNNPDIVVSDILMPNMNGFELCAAMKNNYKTSHIPFIAISSKTESMYQNTSYKQGPDDFMDKPFDVNDVYQTVRFHIGKRIKIQEKYESGAITRLTAENTFSLIDEQFVLKLNGYVDNHRDCVSNMQDLENCMGMSVNEIDNKIKALADTTLKKYIQNILNEKK